MFARLTGSALALWLAFAGSATAQTVGVGTMPQGTLSFSTGSVIAKVMKEAKLKPPRAPIRLKCA